MYFPNQMVTVGDTFYIAGFSNIYKTDKYFNVIKNFYSNASDFTGIYFNSTSNRLYISSFFHKKIYEFDENLTLLDSFNASVYIPCTLRGNNNQLFVGTEDGNLLVMVDKVLTQTIKVCQGLLTSVTFDQYGYMAAACAEPNILKLYHINGTFTGSNMTASYPQDTGFDSKGRFIILSDFKISIYS